MDVASIDRVKSGTLKLVRRECQPISDCAEALEADDVASWGLFRVCLRLRTMDAQIFVVI